MRRSRRSGGAGVGKALSMDSAAPPLQHMAVRVISPGQSVALQCLQVRERLPKSKRRTVASSSMGCRAAPLHATSAVEASKAAGRTAAACRRTSAAHS